MAKDMYLLQNNQKNRGGDNLWVDGVIGPIGGARGL